MIDEKNLLIYNHEGSSEVTVLRFDPQGGLEYVDSIDCLPENNFLGKKEASDIKISSDHKRIYNLTRGINTVSVLEFESGTDGLCVKQVRHFEATTFCGGGARGCALSPDERYFYICVADDGTIHRFEITEGGLLGENDTVINLGKPSNITFYTMTKQLKIFA
jgi:6-phosphogluconolactonase (cycloisomerase 2 family)